MLAATRAGQHHARTTVFQFLREPTLLSSARLRWPHIAIGAACLLLRNTLAVAAPFFTGKAVDVVVQHADLSELHKMLWLVLGFAAITAVCQWWMRWLLIGWSRHTERDMRSGLFQHMLQVRLVPFASLRRGEVLTRLTGAPEAVRMGYGPGLMHAIGTAALGTAALALMLGTAPLLSLVAVLPMLALFVALRPILRRIHTLSTEVQELQGLLAAEAQESFAGMRVVKTLGREQQRAHSFGVMSQRLQQTSLRLVRQRALFSGSIELFAGLALVLIFLFGGRAVLEGEITLGAFTAFSGYLNLLVWPMIALGWTLGLFQSADANLGLINKLRAMETEDLRGSIGLGPALIEARHLSFRHTDAAADVLHDVSFSIPIGATVGVVGRMGSGKSTLLQLLLRLHDPPRGTLFVCGQDVMDWALPDLRRQLAVVLQESFLFSDTLRANILFGHRASDERLDAAVATAALTADLQQLPQGLDTMVGERGVTLSGGQRQRACLARALLLDAPVLLLDDPLSAVDAETEERICAALQASPSIRTTIIVTHRLHALAHADTILVLQEGRLVQQGTHSALLRAEGSYRNLWHAADDLSTVEAKE